MFHEFHFPSIKKKFESLHLWVGSYKEKLSRCPPCAARTLQRDATAAAQVPASARHEGFEMYKFNSGFAQLLRPSHSPSLLATALHHACQVISWEC